MNLKKLHKMGAFIIFLFAAQHIANHLTALAGVPAHMAFMARTRIIYRNPVVETLLFTTVFMQIFSGLSFVIRRWKKRHGFVEWTQALTGSYLAFFLIAHISAVLFGRFVLHLNTNFYYAAAGFHVPPYGFFFAPYYFTAVAALFIHLGCALYWQVQNRPGAIKPLSLAVPAVIGVSVSLIIVLALAGKIVQVEIPQPYKATYLKK